MTVSNIKQLFEIKEKYMEDRELKKEINKKRTKDADKLEEYSQKKYQIFSQPR